MNFVIFSKLDCILNNIDNYLNEMIIIGIYINWFGGV